MRQALDNLWNKTKKGLFFLGVPVLIAGTAGCTLERKITNNFYDPVYDAPAPQRHTTMQPVQEPLPENTAVYGEYETIDDVVYTDEGTAYDMPSQTKSVVVIDQEPESAQVVENNFYFNRSTSPWRIVFENSVYPSSYGWDVDGDGIVGAFDEWPYRYGPIVDMNGNGTPDWSDLDVSGQYYYDYWANHIMYSDFFYGSPSISAWWSWSLFNRHTRNWGHHHHNYWYGDPWHNNYYGYWGYSGHNSYWYPPGRSSVNKQRSPLPHRSNLGYAVRPRPDDNASSTRQTAIRSDNPRTTDPRYRSRDGRTSPANASRENTLRSQTPTTRSRADVKTTTQQRNAVRTTRPITESNRNAVTQRATTQQRQRDSYTPSYTKPRTQTKAEYNRAQRTQPYKQPAMQPRSQQQQGRAYTPSQQRKASPSNTYNRSVTKQRSSSSYQRPSSSSKSRASYTRPSTSTRSSGSAYRSSGGSVSRSAPSSSPSRSSGSYSSGSSGSRSSGSVSRSSSSGSRSSGAGVSRSSGGSSSKGGSRR